MNVYIDFNDESVKFLVEKASVLPHNSGYRLNFYSETQGDLFLENITVSELRDILAKIKLELGEE